MRAREYQNKIKPQLEKHFAQQKVVSEWPASRDATDGMTNSESSYVPRVDIAVGPFNTTPGPASEINNSYLTKEFYEELKGLEPNNNSRCLLAIEITYSGSAKQLMGDIMNASALGLYGIVVAKTDRFRILERNKEYLRFLYEHDKPYFLPDNLRITTTDEFQRLFL